MPLTDAGTEMSAPLKAIDGNADLPALMTELASSARAAARVLALASPEQKNRADRKSTRLNSSHQIISYAVFCLKKKKTTNEQNSNRENSYPLAIPTPQSPPAPMRP